MQAAENGHTEIVRELIKAGAKVDARNEGSWGIGGKGETALMLAAENGHTEVVRELIKAGADVNEGMKSTGTTRHVTLNMATGKVTRPRWKKTREAGPHSCWPQVVGIRRLSANSSKPGPIWR